jgi:transposase-like protein
LRGRVEIDETFVGGSEGDVGRRTEHKSIVLVAAEENGSGIGRIRLARIPDARKKTLHQFIQNGVTRGATLHTDGLVAYRGLEALGYTHHATALVREKDAAAAARLLPRVHRVASLLKRWLLGTHQGAVHAEHLDYYLDEFTFRFNRRKSRSRGKLFYRLLQQAVQIEPAPYHTLVGGSESTNHNI